MSGSGAFPLLFSHPEVCQSISHDGLPIMSLAPFSQHIHDQMNKRWDFLTVVDYLRNAPKYDIVDDGDVMNVVIRVMKLTRGKLLRQDDWTDWQDSEFLQLDQYAAQGMFGALVKASKDDAIFHLVWPYAIKWLMSAKRLAVYAAALRAPVWFGSRPKLMPIMSTKQVHNCSMLSQPQRTYSLLDIYCVQSHSQ